ncbi:hypothetical protein AVAK2825_24135 [Acidovorax sp. SUPP2825]|nr:hypothetical protein AVAK2825_24135 [Acidovorax sp. SUPP2825]
MHLSVGMTFAKSSMPCAGWCAQACLGGCCPTICRPGKLCIRRADAGWDAGCFEAMVSDLRSIIRVAQGRQSQSGAVVMDGRTLQSSCQSGPRAGYDGYKRKRGSKVRIIKMNKIHPLP